MKFKNESTQENGIFIISVKWSRLAPFLALNCNGKTRGRRVNFKILVILYIFKQFMTHAIKVLNHHSNIQKPAARDGFYFFFPVVSTFEIFTRKIFARSGLELANWRSRLRGNLWRGELGLGLGY